jgi:tRNA G18 (ribose-2'-O)-methylase SpoU
LQEHVFDVRASGGGRQAARHVEQFDLTRTRWGENSNSSLWCDTGNTGTGNTGPVLVPIEDPADPRLADYFELTDVAARQRREGHEFFIAEGPVAIERLLQSDHRLRSVLVSAQKYERLASLLEGLREPVYVAATDVLKATVGFDIHRGAVASADRKPSPSLDALLPTVRRIAVLEGLNDPENLGAIARSARAFGIDALVLDPTCIDPYYRRTVRVSMGEILFLPVARASNWTSALDTIRRNGFQIWALTPRRRAADLWTLPVPDRLALLLGAEGPGLSSTAIGAATTDVRIPIASDVDSLNVAAAAAVAFAAIGREPLAGSLRTVGT